VSLGGDLEGNGGKDIVKTFMKSSEGDMKVRAGWTLSRVIHGVLQDIEILPFGPPRSTVGRWAKISAPFTPPCG
jgi:hypothetical protein